MTALTYLRLMCVVSNRERLRADAPQAGAVHSPFGPNLIELSVKAQAAPRELSPPARGT